MTDDPKPLPPEILADALQDKIHKDDGEVRAAKSHKSTQDEARTKWNTRSEPDNTTPAFKAGGITFSWATDPEEVARLRARIEELDALVLEWQPIETAPSDICVLLYCPQRHATNPVRIEAGIFHNTRAGYAWATHWMPLPKPPEKP